MRALPNLKSISNHGIIHTFLTYYLFLGHCPQMVFKSKPFYAYFVSNANKVVVLDVAAAHFTKGEEKLHLAAKRKKRL